MSLAQTDVRTSRGTGVLHFVESHGLLMRLRPDWPCLSSLRTPVPIRLAQWRREQ